MTRSSIEQLIARVMTLEDQERWMVIGYLTEQKILSELRSKVKRGRPKVGASKDGWRAYCVWNVARKLPEEVRRRVTNRWLIERVAYEEEVLGIPNNLRAFPPGGTMTNYESSVSRGKKENEIDIDWNSEVCEKIASDFSQTT